MKYLVCEQPGQFMMKEKPAPDRKPGHALLKIKRIGICGTDLHAYAGNQAFFTYPRILGHELSAEILEIEPNSKGLKEGDPVVIMPYLSCGKCFACRSGKTNCCSRIKVLGVHTDGGMQEMISVPNEILIPSNGLSHEEIAIVEPLAIGAHAIQRAAIKPGEFVLVIGCGPIGMGIIKLAQIAGCKVIAMDVNEQRLQFVQQKMNVQHTVNALLQPIEQIEAITGGDLCPAVFDATGNKKALESGVQYMSHGGRYILVGLSKGTISFNHPSIHAKETTIMCSRNATFQDFKNVIEILKSGLFPTESYISHQVPFEEMIDHFDAWLLPENSVIKAMVYLS